MNPNASSTLTEPISWQKWIKDGRNTIDTYGLFFSMNFTEGGRGIIRLESAGKVSGERGGFSSTAAVYRHLFAGLKAIPPRFSSVSR